MLRSVCISPSSHSNCSILLSEQAGALGWCLLQSGARGGSTDGQHWVAVIMWAVNDITAYFARGKCVGQAAQTHVPALTHTHSHTHPCDHVLILSATHTQFGGRGGGVGDSTPPCMSCTSRCKQAEHRSENGGRGAKTRQTSKLDELKEEGRGRRERRREKRQGSSILTTCTINNGGSAPLSWEQWGWKGMRFWTCSCRSLLNPNLNMPPTHKTRLPFPPPATLNLACSLPCFLTHIQSVSHSLLARSHWLTSTEQQRMEHAAHHELNSSAGTGR